MSYQMRFRVALRGVQNPGTATMGDPAIVEAGDLTTDFSQDANATPTGPVLTSITQAASAIMSLNNRFQRGLGYNVRFQVFGKPVGHAEPGNPDLTADEKEERLYITGDTPSIGLLYAIRKANAKPRASLHGTHGYDFYGPEVGSPDDQDPNPPAGG